MVIISNIYNLFIVICINGLKRIMLIYNMVEYRLTRGVLGFFEFARVLLGVTRWFLGRCGFASNGFMCIFK